MVKALRVLVTGAAGFIGGHLARSLADDGHTVVTIDQQPLNEHTKSRPGIVEVQGDIRDQELVTRAMEGVDVVFHQAAVASVPASFADPALCMAVNVEGSSVIFERARLAGIKRVVMASTSAVYGDDPSPVKHEGLLPAPRSPYAVSKLAMEQLADVYSRQYDMEMVALRYFNVYGPGQPAEGGYAAVIPAIRKAINTNQPVTIYGDGKQTRSFIHVADVVRVNKLAAITECHASEGMLVANVANQPVVSLNDLLQMFEEIIGRPVPIDSKPERHGDIKHSAGDTSFARERLEFESRVPLREGIMNLLESEE